jgi:hypothetical protein
MTETVLCPRCGDPMSTDPNIIPAASRTERDTDIPPDLCPACGEDEAMMDVKQIPLPTRDEWPVKRRFEYPPIMRDEDAEPA